jgi:hypothetical protein
MRSGTLLNGCAVMPDHYRIRVMKLARFEMTFVFREVEFGQ